LKEDIFLKIFFYTFFEGGSSFMVFLNLKDFEDKFSFLKKVYNFQIKKIIKKNDFEGTQKSKYIVKKRKKFRPYLSKI
jgi:hypothetical protein